MRVLIAGGTGLLGKALCSSFHQCGWDVVSLARTSDSLTAKKNLTIDLTNYFELKQIRTDFDLIINASSVIKAEDFESYFVNFRGTENLIRWASEANIMKFLQISSFSIANVHLTNSLYNTFTNKSSFYAISKYLGEITTRNSTLNTTIIRLPALFDEFGEGEAHQPLLYEWIRRAGTGQNIYLNGYGQEFRDYLYVKDAALAISRIATSDARGIFNLIPWPRKNLAELANELNLVFGGKSSIIRTFSYWRENVNLDPLSRLDGNIVKLRDCVTPKQIAETFFRESQF